MLEVPVENNEHHVHFIIFHRQMPLSHLRGLTAHQPKRLTSQTAEWRRGGDVAEEIGRAIGSGVIAPWWWAFVHVFFLVLWFMIMVKVIVTVWFIFLVYDYDYSYSVIYLIEIWLESMADNTINTLINQVVCRSCSHKTMNDLDGQN